MLSSRYLNKKSLYVPIMTCVVIFFWSLGISDCMLFTFENIYSSAHAIGGISGVASFIATDEQLQ